MTDDAIDALLAAVDAAFADTGRGLAPWPDPHPDRSPTDDEYSRVTDPERLRIVSARAEAWTVALVEGGYADVERDVTDAWEEPPRTIVSRTDRVVPRRTGALPLVLARSRIGGVPDAGLTIGVGGPALLAALVPDCGCDACDSGSADLLTQLDEMVLAVVSGRYRHLRRGRSEIIQVGDGTRGSDVMGGMAEIRGALADPSGWDERDGPSWLEG